MENLHRDIRGGYFYCYSDESVESGCEENKMTGGVTSSEDLKGSR